MRLWVLSGLIRVLAVVLALALVNTTTVFAADPVVESVTTEVLGDVAIKVTFAFSDADGDACHVALFGHDTATRKHYPMVSFAETDIYSRTFAPGTHTVTWVASTDTASGFTVSDFKVYVQASDSGRIAPGRYLVIDVSGGAGASSYPVDYVDFVDVSQDEYKTDKIVLRELPDGSYMGVYEITQRQYELVTGATPSRFSGNPKRPVEQVSWDDITGTGGYGSGFIKELRAKAELGAIDLPDEMQWEYACRACTTYNYSDYTQVRGKGSDSTASLDILGWYYSKYGSLTHDAGAKQPNAWGLYDMHGNVWEWTLTASGSDRVMRGGCWYISPDYCESGSRGYGNPGFRGYSIGFRLSLPAGL